MSLNHHALFLFVGGVGIGLSHLGRVEQLVLEDSSVAPGPVDFGLGSFGAQSDPRPLHLLLGHIVCQHTKPHAFNFDQFTFSRARFLTMCENWRLANFIFGLKFEH